MNANTLRTAFLKGHDFLNKGFIQKLQTAEKLPVLGDVVTPLLMTRNVVSAGAHLMHGDWKGGAKQLGACALRGIAEFADIGALLGSMGLGDIVTEVGLRPAMASLADRLENVADASLPNVVEKYHSAQAMKRAEAEQSVSPSFEPSPALAHSAA